MFKRLLAIGLAFCLLGGVAMAEGVTYGTTSSFKERVAIEWVEYNGDKAEFVMINDAIRIQDRLKDQGRPDGLISGFEVAEGTYAIYFETFMGAFPIGYMTWDQICTFVDGWDIFFELDVVRFQTAVGYEDIWAYIEVRNIDVAKKMVRDLNQADLATYDGRD
jgi:hypothetical protein